MKKFFAILAIALMSVASLNADCIAAYFKSSDGHVILKASDCSFQIYIKETRDVYRGTYSIYGDRINFTLYGGEELGYGSILNSTLYFGDYTFYVVE